MFYQILSTVLDDFQNSRGPLYRSLIKEDYKLLPTNLFTQNKEMEVYENDTLFILEDVIDDGILKKMAILNNKGVVVLSGSKNDNLLLFSKYIINPIFYSLLTKIQDVQSIDNIQLQEMIDEVTGGKAINFQTVRNFERNYVVELIAKIQNDDLDENDMKELFIKNYLQEQQLKRNVTMLISTIIGNEEEEKKQNGNKKKTTTDNQLEDSINGKPNQELEMHESNISQNFFLNKQNVNEKDIDSRKKELKVEFKGGKLIEKEQKNEWISPSKQKGYRKKVPAFNMTLPFKPLKEFYDIHEKAQNLNTILNTDFCSLTLFFPYFPGTVLQYKDDVFILFKEILRCLKKRAPQFFKKLNSIEKSNDQIIKPPTLTSIHLAIKELGYSPPNYFFVTKSGDFYVDNGNENTVLVYDRHVELYVGQPILQLPLNEKDFLLYKNNCQQFKNGYSRDYEDV